MSIFRNMEPYLCIYMAKCANIITYRILLNILLFIKWIEIIFEIIVEEVRNLMFDLGVLTPYHQYFSHFGAIIICNIK